MSSFDSLGAICPYCNSRIISNSRNRYRTIDGMIESEEFYASQRYGIVTVSFNLMGCSVLWVHADLLSDDGDGEDVGEIKLPNDENEYTLNYRKHPMGFDSLSMATYVLGQLGKVSPANVHNIVTLEPVSSRLWTQGRILPMTAPHHWHVSPFEPFDNSLWMEFPANRGFV